MELERFMLEIELLRLRYGQVYCDNDLSKWVHISRFNLPYGWNRKTTELLIEIPPTYPHTPPYDFFIDPDLKTKDGRTPSHYEENSRYKKQGWAWLCLHIQNWSPHHNVVDGDNLLTVCQCVYTELTELCR